MEHIRPIVVIEDADETLAQLNLLEIPSQSSRPAPVLLDLNLLGLNDRELLRHIKNTETTVLCPVVILSTANNSRDIEDGYRWRAAGYLCTPLQVQVFADKIKNLMLYWF